MSSIALRPEWLRTLAITGRHPTGFAPPGDAADPPQRSTRAAPCCCGGTAVCCGCEPIGVYGQSCAWGYYLLASNFSGNSAVFNGEWLVTQKAGWGVSNINYFYEDINISIDVDLASFEYTELHNKNTNCSEFFFRSDFANCGPYGSSYTYDGPAGSCGGASTGVVNFDTMLRYPGGLVMVAACGPCPLLPPNTLTGNVPTIGSGNFPLVFDAQLQHWVGTTQISGTTRIVRFAATPKGSAADVHGYKWAYYSTGGILIDGMVGKSSPTSCEPFVWSGQTGGFVILNVNG